MFFENRFTQRAAAAIKAAHEEAGEMGHSYVGSEHILLGLMRDKDSIASKALYSMGLTEDSVKNAVIEAVGSGSPDENAPQGLTPRAKRIIEFAISEAAAMGCSYVGTEHILMGLIREGDNVALEILASLGVDARALYGEVVDGIRGDSGKEDAAEMGASNSARQGAGRGKKGDTKTVDQFGRDLTEMAKQGKLDPIIGRESEIERVIQILSRRQKNNPALIGEPGVGKTAVVEGLAQKIASGDVPQNLIGKRLVALDIGGMLAGTKYRGEFEERIKNIITEVSNAKDIILFIDEMHTMVGAGAAEGAVDAANILKPALSRGEMQVIGATTMEEYRKHIEKDAALERRFQPVTVGEPTEEETVEILKGLRDKYEAHHKVKITDEAISAAAALSARYIQDRFLPDKAIDLIDEACSRKRMSALTAPPDLKKLEEKVSKIKKEKEEAVRTQDFEKAAQMRDEEKKLQEEIEKAKTAWKENSTRENGEIGEGDIAELISKWTGIPVTRLTETEAERLMHMEDILHRRIIGQDEAVSAVSKAVRRGRVGLKDPKRPTGSFIFLGPTGVGKTELCRALAEALFGDENAMIRVDMSEYMEKHTVSKLIGSPPGYVGYDDGGTLTEKIRRKPYSVILFDEIEKAHPDVFNILLQMLEDGHVTDSHGRRVNCKNAVIIMTSNVGARRISEMKKLGFAANDDQSQNDEKKIKADVLAELRGVFRPEFLNRVDDIIVFNKLTEDDIKNIAKNMLETVKKRVSGMGIEIDFDESAIAHLAKIGFDPVYGARPLRRAIQAQVEDRMAEKFLDGSVKEGSHVKASEKDGAIEFTCE